MFRIKLKINRAFIDPVSILTGLFLVVALVVSTAVVKNRQISLNINEKAAVQKDDCAYGVCGSGCCSAPAPKAPKNNDSVANAPTKPVVNEPAPDPKNCGYCSGTTCVDCANGDDDKGECTNNLQCAAGSVNAPPPATIQPLTTTPINNNLEQAEVQNIQQVITAPVVINGTVVNPATNAPVDKPAVVEVKSPQTVSLQPIPTSTPSVSTSSTCSPGCPSGQSCVLIGMGYYGCQNTTGLNSITKYADSTCANKCTTNQECVVNNVVNGKKEYVCKTVEYVPYTPQHQSNPCPAGSTYTNGTCITNQQNITNAENQIAALNQTPSTPAVTTALQDFVNSLTDRFNNVNQSTGMTDIGTYGLGGGNAPVLTPPNSVIESGDINQFWDFYQGAGVSALVGGAAGSAALVGAGTFAPQIIAANQALAAWGGATLATLPASAQAAIGYTASALTVGGTAYSSYDCLQNGPNSPACVGLITGYQTDPVGFNQQLGESMNPINNYLNSQIDNMFGNINFSNVDAPNYSTANLFNNEDEVLSYLNKLNSGGQQSQYQTKLIEEVIESNGNSRWYRPKTGQIPSNAQMDAIFNQTFGESIPPQLSNKLSDGSLISEIEATYKSIYNDIPHDLVSTYKGSYARNPSINEIIQSTDPINDFVNKGVSIQYYYDPQPNSDLAYSLGTNNIQVNQAKVGNSSLLKFTLEHEYTHLVTNSAIEQALSGLGYLSPERLIFNNISREPASMLNGMRVGIPSLIKDSSDIVLLNVVEDSAAYYNYIMFGSVSGLK